MAVGAGADALGLVSEMPSGPGVIDEAEIAEIARIVPPPIATFLLTSRKTADGIADQVHAVGVNTVQIVDHIDPGEYARLRVRLPTTKIVQVVHVTGRESIDIARRYATLADVLLLDSGNPHKAVAELGGTGRTHDWALSRQIIACVHVPVFLAGGLRPENIAEAIVAVRPFGVDLCSGVRTNGELDPEKLTRFIAALNAA
ncbi:MAG: phosphoribosylanthranilate isomerase [Hyphomicrobiaceae bacterium]|nr:phosphoribosylanthranilate isomerase [Hyphomicrobiaceae bacterium]